MFTTFSKAVQKNFAEMSKGELYVVRMQNDMADMYLAAFPEGTNPIYRVRTVHDCVCCKHFVRRLGHVVAIKDGKLQTIWDGLDHLPTPFKEVAAKLGHIVRSQPIASVFRTDEAKYGLDHNYDKVTNERHDHFEGVIASRHQGESKRGTLTETFDMFKYGLDKFGLHELAEVLELIDNNDLYKGAEFRPAIKAFYDHLIKYHDGRDKDLYVWANVHDKHARFKGTLIGELFDELSKGKEFADAVIAYEKRADPLNYKRTTAPISQGMVEKALETLNKLQLQSAIARRYAKLSDVSVNEVLFVDNHVQLKDNIAALLESSIKRDVVSVKNATPISADEFVKTVLPAAKKVEALVENRHAGNFMSLTTSDSPQRLFKWDNPFAWVYDGDVADSVKQRVKAAGGNIHAKLRVSLSWFNTDDLDLHAKTPDNQHIYFRNMMGILDVDMNAHSVVRNPVENLAFQHVMDGIYEIGVHQFRQREHTDVGFAIEVEMNGVIHQYSYPKAVKDMVTAFKLDIRGGKIHFIDTQLEGGNTPQDKWGVKTETLIPVQAVLNSPNHWNGNPIGAKHLIFALKGCKNPGQARGFLNEQLRSDLEPHRKVFEVLGAKTKCPVAEEQVSGVGFTAARGDSVTVVVDGRRAYVVGF